HRNTLLTAVTRPLTSPASASPLRDTAWQARPHYTGTRDHLVGPPHPKPQRQLPWLRLGQRASGVPPRRAHSSPGRKSRGWRPASRAAWAVETKSTAASWRPAATRTALA